MNMQKEIYYQSRHLICTESAEKILLRLMYRGGYRLLIQHHQVAALAVLSLSALVVTWIGIGATVAGVCARFLFLDLKSLYL